MTRRKFVSHETVSSLLDSIGSSRSIYARRTDQTRVGRFLAAQYVRVSTDQQVYSAANQKAAIREYAVRHNLQIVQTYEDDSKSGLLMRNRPALRNLLMDVLTGNSLYRIVIVYDVSRWGRFDDEDESACYEFLCRRAGASIEYCAELFPEGAPVAGAVLKSLKRSMAAEFSRQLSAQIFEAKSRRVQQGYWGGGPAPYGMHRYLVPGNGKPGRVLKPGEWTNLKTDHSILVPGFDDEVAVIRKMFHMAVDDQMGCPQIAKELNNRGTSNRGKPWNKEEVYKILTSPAYIGTNVWNRNSEKLRGPIVRNPPDRWIQRENAFLPVISRDLFARANRLIHNRGTSWTMEEIFNRLRSLLRQKGRLTESLIAKTNGMPSNRTLRNHFGSLMKAYQLIGYKVPSVDAIRCNSLCSTLRLRHKLLEDVLASNPSRSLRLLEHTHRPILLLDGKYAIAVFAFRSVVAGAGDQCWQVVPRKKAHSEDLALLGLLDETNEQLHAVYLFKRCTLSRFHRFRESDPLLRQGVQLGSLSELPEKVQELIG